MARYEFAEGTSSKFWEIELSGDGFTVRFGRIGTAGQTQTKSFASAAVAQAEHDKLVNEKVKKGYQRVGAPPAPAAEPDTVPATPAAATAPAPAPATPAAPAEVPPAAPVATPPIAEDGFVDAGNGYALGIVDGRIVARNKAGKQLASVPKDLKSTEAFAVLEESLAFFEQHEAECRATVDTWMLRSLPVPRAAVEAVWPDPTWRALLENAVIRTHAGDGLLRGVSDRGLGLVTLDGDTVWVRPETLTIPHPILLDDLDEYRSLLAEVGLKQGLSQLFRETFRKPTPRSPDEAYVSDWAGAEFPMLAMAMGEAKRGGWRVRGGAASCTTWEGGTTWEARYDLGDGDPMYETTTGPLYWVNTDGETVPLAAVGAVAWSEGMRMASMIHKKRKVEEKKDGDDNA